VVADAVGRLVANGVCGRIKEAQTKLEINIFELEQTNISTTHIACVSGCTAWAKKLIKLVFVRTLLNFHQI